MRVIKKERKLAFARFGEKSGVRAVDVFPSLAEQAKERSKAAQIEPNFNYNNVSFAN